MKKLIPILILPVFFLTGCVFNSSSGNKNKFSDVTSLFIINPTTQDTNDEGWVSQISASRTVSESENNVLSTDTEEASVLENSLESLGIKSPTFFAAPPELSESRDAAEESTQKPVIKFKVGQSRSFQNSFDSFLSEAKIFKCVYESEFCYIWTYPKEDEVSKLSDEEIVEFAKKFDKLYEKEIALCGPKYDGTYGDESIINPNDKMSILLYDIDNDKASQYYWGYVSYDDMSKYSSYSTCKIEAIHVDSYAAKQEDSKNALFSVLAHEFNHKLNYDNKILKYSLSLDSWYTEMLSLLVEDFFYEDLGISALDSSQARLGYFISGCYVYGFKNWQQRANLEGYKYANAYAFGAYLARNYGGAKLIHEICTNEYANEDSVVKAVNKINGTNLTFKDLLKEYPLILVNINNEDEALPSLDKSTSDTIDGFEFKLNPINKEVFETDDTKISIKSCSIDSATTNPLYAYGFQYYSFDNKTNLTVKADDSLLVVTK